MADDQTPPDKPPLSDAAPRRAANPPIATSKNAGKPVEPPTSSPGAAIPPDEMNAQNDK